MKIQSLLLSGLIAFSATSAFANDQQEQPKIDLGQVNSVIAEITEAVLAGQDFVTKLSAKFLPESNVEAGLLKANMNAATSSSGWTNDEVTVDFNVGVQKSLNEDQIPKMDFLADFGIGTNTVAMIQFIFNKNSEYYCSTSEQTDLNLSDYLTTRACDLLKAEIPSLTEINGLIDLSLGLYDSLLNQWIPAFIVEVEDMIDQEQDPDQKEWLEYQLTNAQDSIATLEKLSLSREGDSLKLKIEETFGSVLFGLNANLSADKTGFGLTAAFASESVTDYWNMAVGFLAAIQTGDKDAQENIADSALGYIELVKSFVTGD
ncbi:hypothetical protein GW916_14170 [bacterium]|nr:hypothetical protein [bacterium]